MHQEYMKLVRTKESLENRIDGKELDNEKTKLLSRTVKIL